MKSILEFAALLLVGLIAGATFGIWRGYNPTNWTYGAFVQVHRGTVEGLNVLLPAMGVASVILLAFCAYAARADRRSAVLFVVAALLLVAGGIITRLVNQPINVEIISWLGETPPSAWQVVRDKWWSWHLVRTGLSLLGFAFALTAALR